MIDIHGNTVTPLIQSDEHYLRADETFSVEWTAPEWLKEEILVSGIIVVHPKYPSPDQTQNTPKEKEIMPTSKNTNIAVAVGAVAVTAVASRFVWKRFRNRKAK